MARHPHEMPPAVQARLWQAAGDMPAYAILDGARDPGLRDALHADGAPPWRCLFTGQDEPDLARVAPYLVALDAGAAFTRRLLAEGWGRGGGVFLASRCGLPALWRHVRQQVPVYGPGLVPLACRFYDPRVLRDLLPVCTPAQLAAFFGPVELYLAEHETPERALVWSLAGGRLVAQVLD